MKTTAHKISDLIWTAANKYLSSGTDEYHMKDRAIKEKYCCIAIREAASKLPGSFIEQSLVMDKTLDFIHELGCPYNVGFKFSEYIDYSRPQIEQHDEIYLRQQQDRYTFLMFAYQVALSERI